MTAKFFRSFGMKYPQITNEQAIVPALDKRMLNTEKYPILNKRGQLGKTLSFPFVLIMLMIIVALFFVALAGLSALRGEKGDEQEGRAVKKVPAWLLEEVCVSKEEQQDVKTCKNEERMLLADALVLFADKKLERDAVEEGIKRMLLARGEGNCAAIALGQKENPAGRTGGATLDDVVFEYRERKLSGVNRGAYPSIFRRYRDAGVFEQLRLRNARTQQVLFVEGYVGRCVG